MGVATGSGRAANVALPGQPLRQEARALAGAKLGVVREHDVLHSFENRLVAEPPDGDVQSVSGIAVTARLRAEGIRVDAQQAVWPGRQSLQSIDAEGVHRSRRRG